MDFCHKTDPDEISIIVFAARCVANAERLLASYTDRTDRWAGVWVDGKENELTK